MKATSAAVVAGAACLFLVACAASEESKKASEAEAQAKQYWDRAVTRCGDETYLGDIHSAFTEYKGFSYKVISESLAGADKLNGWEWRGQMAMHATAFRGWTAGGTYDKARWTAWADSRDITGNAGNVGLSVALTEWNGRWYYDRQDASTFRYFDPIDCTKIPQ